MYYKKYFFVSFCIFLESCYRKLLKVCLVQLKNLPFMTHQEGLQEKICNKNLKIFAKLPLRKGVFRTSRVTLMPLPLWLSISFWTSSRT